MKPNYEKTVLYAIYVFQMVSSGKLFSENVHFLLKAKLEIFLAFLRLQNQGYFVGCVPTGKALDEVEKEFDIDDNTYGYERACKVRDKCKACGWSYVYHLADRAIQIFEDSHK